MSKTVMVVISKNIMRRNILETDFWPTFVKEMEGNKIVLVGEEGEKEMYQEKFGADNVTVDTVRRVRLGLWHKVILFLVRTGTNTRGVRLYRWRSYTLGQAGLLATISKTLIANTFARFSFYHRFIRFLYSRLSLPWIEDLFEKHKPDMVFAPALIDIAFDAMIGASARRRNIKVVGMVRSWDNLAIHGLFPFIPDVFIFQNKFLKECAVKLQSIDLSKIRTSIIGLPHYDSYRFPESYIKTREEFFQEYGLNPSKKLILLGGFDFYWSEYVLPANLDNAIDERKVEEPAQVVFRPHPSTPFKMSDYKIGELKHTILNAPFLDKSTAFSDKDFFINLLYHCDVLINVASTLAIDGAVFDKPVICINFDDPCKNLSKWERVGRLYDSFDHYEALMETGCAKISNSFDEMINDINVYIKNPSLHHEGRMKAIDRFVAPFEGDSGMRLVKEVLNEVKSV